MSCTLVILGQKADIFLGREYRAEIMVVWRNVNRMKAAWRDRATAFYLLFIMTMLSFAGVRLFLYTVAA